MKFMSQLRSRQSEMGSSRKDYVSPPSFYDEDIAKFKNKFRHSIEQRRQFKQLIAKDRSFVNDHENINNRRSRYFFDPEASLISDNEAQI